MQNEGFSFRVMGIDMKFGFCRSKYTTLKKKGKTPFQLRSNGSIKIVYSILEYHI